jgi:hypothetical protein
MRVRPRRLAVLGVLALVVLGAGGLVARRAATRLLARSLVAALGAGSEIGGVEIGWSAVELRALRLRAPHGWPVTDALRAARVVVVPRLRTLVSERVEIASLTVVAPYLSVVRTRDGRLRILPTLIEGGDGAAGAVGGATRSVLLSRIVIEDGVVELHDGAVAAPPLRTRLEAVRAQLGDVVAPALDGRATLELAAVVKGIRHDGRLRVTGWASIAGGDSAVRADLHTLDLVHFQSYLTRAADLRIERGVLDLELRSEVRAGRLHAPGRAVISELVLPPAEGAFGTFMGLPRAAVLKLLRARDGRIDLAFVVEGDPSDPRFRLNEALATRVVAALGEQVGVSAWGLGRDAETLGRKGVAAAAEAARGAAGVVRLRIPVIVNVRIAPS